MLLEHAQSGKQCFSCWIHLEHVGKLGNNVSATEMFLNLLGNILAFWEANFVSATMFPEVGKQGNIGAKHNVSQQCFLLCPRVQTQILLSENV